MRAAAPWLLAVALGTSVEVYPKQAHAFLPLVIAQAAFQGYEYASKLRSGVLWLQCQTAIERGGGDCPLSEVAIAAEDIINEVSSEIVAEDRKQLITDALTLADTASRYYRGAMLSVDDERTLLNMANATFNNYYVTIRDADPHDRAKAQEIYTVLANFQVVSALTESIFAIATSRGMNPASLMDVDTFRKRTVEANYLAVGWPYVEYSVNGAISIVNGEDSFSHGGIIKKTAIVTSDYQKTIYREDCNLSWSLESPAKNMCHRNSDGCFWGVCAAAAVDTNSTYLADGSEILEYVGKLSVDPVITIAQATIAHLMRLGVTQVSDPYNGVPTGTLRFLPVPNKAVSFDAGITSDLAAFSPGDFTWQLTPSGNPMPPPAAPVPSPFGAVSGIPVPADYDVDGRADLALWRPLDGNWFIQSSRTLETTVTQWGLSDDVPVPANYQNSWMNLAVWRPSEGNWYIRSVFANAPEVTQWGLPADVPVPADYDGDGVANIAVWRPWEGNWYVLNARHDSSVVRQWGTFGDVPVPADYTGDGKADFAVFRPSDGHWHVINSANGLTRDFHWGQAGDRPVPGDFDGDQRADYAVWRPSENRWYVMSSLTGAGWSFPGGHTPNDIPLP